jgi:hypothetical protein
MRVRPNAPTPAFPLLLEMRKEESKISPGVIVTGHRVREIYRPNSPTIGIGAQNFREVRFARYFPNESGAAIVRGNNKSVTVIAMFGFEVGYFAQAESIHDNILQNREAVVNRRTVRRIQKRRAVSRCACGFGVNRKRSSRYCFVLLLVSHFVPVADFRGVFISRIELHSEPGADESIAVSGRQRNRRSQQP